MSKERELLRRALEAWDLMARSGEAAKTFEDIRTFLAVEPEAEPVKFLCDARRFKVTGSKAEGMIYGLPQNLIGKWVAFVDAVNGQHFKYTRPEPSRKPMTEEEIWKLYCGVRADTLKGIFSEGVRFAEQHHGIKGDS